MKSKNFEIKVVVVVFSVLGKRETHFGTNAIVLDLLFSDPDWIYSVKIKRQQFETENLKLVLIDVEEEKNMALK